MSAAACYDKKLNKNSCNAHMQTVNYLDLEPTEFLDLGSTQINKHHEDSFNQNYDVNVTQANTMK